ncbi:MAG: hypothetical protein JWP89_692 [Schlesneria sp.]|nr:hypothetical protein [Schlesneria sp.]
MPSRSIKIGLLINFNNTRLKEEFSVSFFDSFVHFVSFVVKEFLATSAITADVDLVQGDLEDGTSGMPSTKVSFVRIQCERGVACVGPCTVYNPMAFGVEILRRL